MNELIFFSHNINKIKEVKKILHYYNLKILTLLDLSKTVEPEENGSTFKENAIIKSKFGYNKFGKACFADDSGICIEALGGEPGVYSKRFQYDNGGLNKTIEKILYQTKTKNNFNAFFQTSIALTTKSNKTFCFDGIVHGKISVKAIGTMGFHYDPIFIPKGTNKTYAQMSIKEKNNVSHRGKALTKLINFVC